MLRPLLFKGKQTLSLLKNEQQDFKKLVLKHYPLNNQIVHHILKNLKTFSSFLEKKEEKNPPAGQGLVSIIVIFNKTI